jgi:hypothetical protein
MNIYCFLFIQFSSILLFLKIPKIVFGNVEELHSGTYKICAEYFNRLLKGMKEGRKKERKKEGRKGKIKKEERQVNKQMKNKTEHVHCSVNV